MAVSTPKQKLALRDVQGLRGIDTNLRNLLQALVANQLYVYGHGDNPAIFRDQYNDELSSIIGSGDTGLYSSATATSNYTMASTLNTLLVDANDRNITVKLPKLGGNKGKLYRIKRIDDSNNTVTIQGRSTSTIDGTTQTLERQWAWMAVENTGKTWHIMSKEDGLSKEADDALILMQEQLRESQESLNNQLEIMNMYLSEMVGDTIEITEIELNKI